MKNRTTLPRAAAVLAAITLLASCAGRGTDIEQLKDPAAAVSSVKPSPTMTKKEKSVEVLRKSSAKNLKADGVTVSKKTHRNKYGKFPVLGVSPGTGIAKFDPAILKKEFPQGSPTPETAKGLPAGWTTEEAADAQAFAADVLVDRYYNSPMNGDKSSMPKAEKLFNEVMSKATATKLASQTEAFLVPVPGKDLDAYPKYDPDENDPHLDSVYDGVTPRINNVNVRAKAARAHQGEILFQFDGTFDWNAIDVDSKEPYTFKIKMVNYFSLAKEGEGFLVNGRSMSWSFPDEYTKVTLK